MSEHSKIYRGEVTHKRMGPVAHAFTYPMTFFAFDLAELAGLAREYRLFQYNQAGVLQLWDRDYLRGREAPLLEQLGEFLPAPEADDRTVLVTSPKYFGYAFNPVNFHLRLRKGELVAALAEVNNTFGDRHIYPLPDLKREDPTFWTARKPKNFHVSPFNNMAGDYHFNFRIETDELFLGVDLYRDGDCVMKTWIHGRGKSITNAAIVRHALLRPLNTALNSMPRILWQAARLHYQKKMRVFQRPSPTSADTLIDRDKPKEKNRVI